MIYFTSTLLNIAVYLISFAVIYHVLYKRFTDTLNEIETEYRLNYARTCMTFIDTMQTVTQALQAQQTEEEPPAPDPEYIEPYPEMRMVRANEI